jgi:hypothetical protein
LGSEVVIIMLRHLRFRYTATRLPLMRHLAMVIAGFLVITIRLGRVITGTLDIGLIRLIVELIGLVRDTMAAVIIAATGAGNRALRMIVRPPKGSQRLLFRPDLVEGVAVKQFAVLHNEANGGGVVDVIERVLG